MLFSNRSVASVINLNFEPVWVSVRPVPQVTIDFGSGNVIRRTLHGNVATYVCDAEGHVLDVLSGIYEPEAYIDRLRQMVLLHRYARQSVIGTEETGDDESEALAMTLRDYHEQQQDSLTTGVPLELMERDMSIIRTEGPLHVMLVPARRIAARAASVSTIKNGAISPEKLKGVAKSLEEDTRINEGARRRAIHEYLATAGLVHPDEMRNWLYREVLHADLDDPWLGLGRVLFDNYPFEE